MVLRLIKAVIRWPLIAVTIGGLTYTNHSRIERVVNTYKFKGINAEEEYIDKRNAFKLRFDYEINDEENLETFLMNGDHPLPVFKRKNKIMVGTAEYNYNNFTEKEKIYLCPSRPSAKLEKPVSKPKKESSLFRDLYDIVSD